MKALIQKDVYVLWKQVRIFLLVIVFLTAVGGTFNSIFIVAWCSMMPYTALAYDERSHWGQLAAMMPYSRRDIVLSKYVLGWLCAGLAVLICLVMQTATSVVTHSPVNMGLMAASFLMAVLALDVTFPLVLRFGVERGRLGFMMIVFAMAVVGSVLLEDTEELQQVQGLVMAALPLAAVAATAVSVPLSLKLYRVN